MRRALVLLGLAAIVGACSSDTAKEVGTEGTTRTTAEATATTTTSTRPKATTTAKPKTAEPLTRADLGDAWPFTVEAGTLRCEGGSSVVFVADGKSYAINGTARSQTDYPDVDRIWADDPRPGYGPKKDIGPIIDRGLKLCP